MTFSDAKGWFEIIPDWSVAAMWVVTAWASLWFVTTSKYARAHYSLLYSYPKVSVLTFVLLGAVFGGLSGYLMWWSARRVQAKEAVALAPKEGQSTPTAPPTASAVDQAIAETLKPTQKDPVLPPRNPIHWSTQLVPSDRQDMHFKMLVTVQTDEVTENPTFRITGDSSFSFGAFDMGVHAVYGTSRQVSESVLEVGLRQSFTPRTPLTVVLYNPIMFRIIRVERVY